MMTRFFLYAGCLLLLGCGAGSGDDPQTVERTFEGTGRTAEQIIADIQSENFDASLTVYESAAYNMCDCLSQVDLAAVRGIFDKMSENNIGMANDAQSRSRADSLYQTLSDSERQSFEGFQSCGMVPLRELFQRAPNNPPNDSVLIYMQTLCPGIYREFEIVGEGMM